MRLKKLGQPNILGVSNKVILQKDCFMRLRKLGQPNMLGQQNNFRAAKQRSGHQTILGYRLRLDCKSGI